MNRFRMTTILAVLLAVTIIGLAPAHASEKTRKIREILEITHAIGFAKSVIDVILPPEMARIRKANPTASSEALDQVAAAARAEFNKTMDGYVDQMVVVWDKIYTADEVSAMLNFYQSPMGRRIVAKMPTMQQKALELGQTWAVQVSKRVYERVQQAAKAKGLTI